MERNIISIDEYGKVVLPTDMDAIAMSEWELLRVVQCNRPDHQGRDKGALQVRSSERVRDKAHNPPIRQVQYGGLQP